MPDTFHLSPASRPYVDAQAFRDAMASMGSTVCVVATLSGGERLGRTVTSAFSLSAEPPVMLVSIGKTGRLADRIAKAGGFSFAMLADGQQAIADAFASHGDSAERFDTGEWLSWESGHPRLSGAAAAMDCALVGAIETETHVLFAGGVVDVDVASDRAPLMWQQRHYTALADPSPAPAAIGERST